ncbi:MAG: MBL fold metallo-hydrolase [Clostridia bacterium]|nr:MBL fold metallo-hydrolase [Clostridia bacterium]
MSKGRTDIPITEIAPDIYLLDEFTGTNCYLVVGSEKALLIDCGTGLCDFEAVVRNITDLPLTVVATHGHVDHFGGACLFPEIYVHKDDCKPVNKMQLSRALRTGSYLAGKEVREQGVKLKDIQKKRYNTKLIPIEEGFKFDLGNKTLWVKHLPGHTKGSIALVDEADKIIFSGDNVCDSLWMFVPGCTSMEEWVPSAEWLLKMAEDYKIYWGHRTPEIKKDYIATVIGYGKELIAKTEKNTRFYKISQYPKQADGILYRTDMVLKK